MKRFATLLVVASTLLVSSQSFAGEADWAQWRGPNRNGHAAPQNLMQSWPAGGPKPKWVFRAAGIGYSAFSIVNDRLYTMGAKGSDCLVICLDVKTGQPVWEKVISRAAADNDYAHGWGGGPRSTPTVDGEHLYALSDVGVLACLKIADGAVVWSVDFVNQYDGSIPKWGYSESVLVDGDRVIGTPGGKYFMVGFDKLTGKEVWTSDGVKEQAQYVSPVKHSVGETSFYVTASRAGLSAFDTKTGKLLFKDGATGNNVAVIPTPVVSGEWVYHTSAYDAGNTLLKLTASDNGTIAAESVYHLSTKSMQNHHGGTVLVDGVMYGFTKASGGQWMAQDLVSGETLWSQQLRPNRSGSVSYADGRLYCYNDEDGSVILVEPSREGWKKHGEMKLPEKTAIERGSGAIWAHPIIAAQTLFLRDQDLIFAFDLARQ
jgi:outer membrane protein assembly factor BamB